MAVKFTNNAKTTLASSLTNVATSASVVDGSVFPTLGAGEYFYCTFDDGSNNEIVKVTARSGNTLTIVRGVDNTTARAFSSGDAAELRATAGLLTDIQENIAAKSANQTVYNTTTASSATSYDIGIDPSVEANAMVFLNGVMQHHDTFSFSGSTLTFDTAPSDGMALEVIVDNLINLQSSNLTVDTFTAADVSGSPQTDFTLSDSPAAETNLIVFVDGVFQDQDAYTISSNVLTMTDGVIADRVVTVYVINPVNIGTPSDGTVTSAKLSGNITMPGSLTVTSYDVAFDSPTFVVDNANSRVGIGTASPSTLLDIVGDVKMSADLTVDTNTLYVDSTNNRVGIGTSSPTARLEAREDVNGEANFIFSNLDTTSGSSAHKVSLDLNFNRTGSGFNLAAANIVAGKEQEWVGAAANQDGYLAFYTTLNETPGERVRITSAGNVGIGTSSNISSPLTVQTNGSASALSIIGRNNGTSDEAVISFYEYDGTTRNSYIIKEAGDLAFATGTGGSPSERMRITSSGTVYAKSSSGVVTDGLVTHLEALNADSYPGSGSTWYDLAGNNNASLTNFSYNYKDHFDITNTGYTGMTNSAYGQSSCTVCVLMSTNDTQAVTFVGNNPNAYIGAWEDTGTQNFYHNASGTVTYYINGEQTSAWTNRRSRARGKWMWIEMKNVDFTSSYWTTLNFNGYGGSYVMTNYNSVVGAILVYNKSLSDAERQQNFAYIRRTYGETPDWATQVIQPTLNSPYSNYGGSYAPMEYYKDTTGHVHITGLMAVSSSTTAIPFTMPVGYRPKNTIMFDSNSQSPGEGIMAWDLTNAGYWTPRRAVNGWTNIDAIYYPDGE